MYETNRRHLFIKRPCGAVHVLCWLVHTREDRVFGSPPPPTPRHAPYADTLAFISAVRSMYRFPCGTISHLLPPSGSWLILLLSSLLSAN